VISTRRACLVGLRHLDGQHTLVSDAVIASVFTDAGSVVRNSNRPVRRVRRRRMPGALTLLELAGDGQDAAAGLDLHVVALHARQLSLDDVRIVGLLHIDGGGPTASRDQPD
jgi:hypothetical protein